MTISTNVNRSTVETGDIRQWKYVVNSRTNAVSPMGVSLLLGAGWLSNFHIAYMLSKGIPLFYPKVLTQNAVFAKRPGGSYLLTVIV